MAVVAVEEAVEAEGAEEVVVAAAETAGAVVFEAVVFEALATLGAVVAMTVGKAETKLLEPR